MLKSNCPAWYNSLAVSPISDGILFKENNLKCLGSSRYPTSYILPPNLSNFEASADILDTSCYKILYNTYLNH